MAKKELDSVTKKAARQGLLIVIVAVITLEATAVLQYFYSRHILSEEATRRAEGQLAATELHIANVVDQVETAVRNSIWSVQQQMNRPDSLAAITVRLVGSNPVICGSTVALVEKDLAPYSYEQEGDILTSTLATEEYDYKHQEWFVKPLELRGGYWSEPYFDEGGGNMLMTTYSIPVRDKKGRVAAVFTADVSLDWLTELVGSVKVYPTAFSMLVSRTGQIMVCPVETLVMKKTIQELAASMDDSTTFQSMNRSLLSGESGSTTFRYEGKVHYMFFDSVERTGWAMTISIPEDEIFGNIKRLGFLIIILQIIGVTMIIFILYYTIKQEKDLRLSEQGKHRIEGELQVARGIQMSMIPKIFPAFPERKDLDMAAMLVPAKEVGGDLYDFFIREERLYFCVGDVSGKGVPASLVMAVTRSLFRTLAGRETSPAQIVGQMNTSMSDMNESNMFVTLFCGVLDMKTGHLEYCNAGHNAPLIFTDNIAAMPVVANLPLGIMQEFDFQQQSLDLHHDDALFLYTDGVTEAENIHHELFGDERLEEVMHERRTAQEHLEAVRDAITAFVGEAPQSDDITLLFIHYLG